MKQNKKIAGYLMVMCMLLGLIWLQKSDISMNALSMTIVIILIVGLSIIARIWIN